VLTCILLSSGFLVRSVIFLFRLCADAANTIFLK
jgi:hypothetical protein